MLLSEEVVHQNVRQAEGSPAVTQAFCHRTMAWSTADLLAPSSHILTDSPFFPSSAELHDDQVEKQTFTEILVIPD